ncbi:MAG: aldo/keto reductase [bacterium]|nr:aldo/keto reductase [bacterium]
MTAGHATPQGTERFASRFPEAAVKGFYRKANSHTISSLGLGTYLGGPDNQTDRNYLEAIWTALTGGINLIDTSLNYRLQHSELCVGAALRTTMEAGKVQRDEVVIATKAGYLVPKAVPKDLLRPEDIVSGIHSMAPAFLSDQLDRSLDNLGLETVDIFYLHNPETQVGHVSSDELVNRFRLAFQALEAEVERGRIQAYGAATWQGFRALPETGKGLPLPRLVELAKEVAGDSHHFRYIQLPFNMAMTEALRASNDALNGKAASVLDLAAHHGITAIASATLLQSKLAHNLPDNVTSLIGGDTDAQRAIQFARSAPGIASALVGMSKSAHVRENLGIMNVAPVPDGRFREQFGILYQ